MIPGYFIERFTSREWYERRILPSFPLSSDWDRSSRRGVRRYLLRIPRFFFREGQLIHRLEHLVFADHWEFPQECTWSVVGKEACNRPWAIWKRICLRAR